jgi:hypothetical protein
MPPDEVYRFNQGRLSPPLLPRHVALPADSLIRFLRRQEHGWRRLLVFQDPYAKARDPVIAERPGPAAVAFHGEDVYQLISAREMLDPLALPVGEFPIIGVATQFLAAKATVSDGATLTPGAIEELARNCRAILVGAWDAENYIVLDRGLLAELDIEPAGSLEPADPGP